MRTLIPPSLPVVNRCADKLTQQKMSGSPTTSLFPLPCHTTARGTCMTRTVSSRTGNSISRLVGPITRFCEHSGSSEMTPFQIKNTLRYISRTSPIIDLLHVRMLNGLPRISFAISYGLSFAALTSTIVHTFCMYQNFLFSVRRLMDGAP
jgi:hypothetical protein